MKLSFGILAAIVACGLAVGTPASAQQADTASQIKQLEQAQQELRTELDGLKREMQAMREQLQQALAQMRSAQQPAQPQPRPAAQLVGKPAPEYTFKTIDGKEMKIGGNPGKPQVVFCYASWCGFCRKAQPWIETVYQSYKDKGVDVLAINLDDRGDPEKNKRAKTEEQSLQQYNEAKLTMPMTMTTADNDTRKVAGDYKVQSFPTLFVVGKDGTIEAVHIGAKEGLDKTIAAELDILLAGKTRADFPAGS
ncbi:MAG TPA: TlpA disulfide reductase family protein [Phycisphaerae bacterium]|nr:TlpA disulfide reductase family protein [Phycisphaerae bacterium]HNU44934.1 TlpA disulfide reductase family protein [Phycisphaerae bacterium]